MTPPSQPPPTTCFSCTRLNASTFRIVEDDQWSENPFIYAKLCAAAIVIIDTGCGGAARDPAVQLTSLREFLETYPVDDNGGKPLNPGGSKAYEVVCTHCHYDHIGGIEGITETQHPSSIWASANIKSFILDDLPTSSLCRYVGMKTPSYSVSHWAQDGQVMRHTSASAGTSHDLDGLVLYHAPGHTPDSLAIWDPHERFLFVGDTLYEWAPILFPSGAGDLSSYSSTIFKLRDLIRGWNSTTVDEDEDHDSAQTGSATRLSRVRMACGHVTSAVDAQEFVLEVDKFFSQVTRGLIEGQDAGEQRGVPLVKYERHDGRISFIGPKALFNASLVGQCPV
ncbi:beta-lactamase-like protein [Coniella lustricola]|uniref:Beta-lactamase-like protein n=1 Tax=Coniella lustricola TaxID=2025994 RepID=A0A2T2ZYJ2_9PEZI|nr:beta-lactamase-like protein [Coniella lustricola]